MKRSRTGPGLPASPGLPTVLAIGVGLVVTLLALRGIEPIGAGVYYDDGVYLSLARSLATGEGYTYGNLPGSVPGVKYPPVYPATLAAAWKIAPSYPENLGLLKGLNALWLGLAASFAFLAVGGAWRAGAGSDRRREGAGVVMPGAGDAMAVPRGIALGILAIAALFSFGSVQAMILATALLAEPLFLFLAFVTLWLAGRRDVHPAWIGLFAALAYLTRGIGLALLAAVVLGEIARRRGTPGRRLRRAGWTLLGSLPLVAAWTLWSRSRTGDVPAVLAGPYGAYGAWFAEDGALGAGELAARLPRVAASHWGSFVSNLEMLWFPQASATVANFVLVLLGLVCVAGAVRLARRNPALVLFPVLYLLIVFAWPYEPDRFFYAIFPLLTLFLAAGGLALTERIKEDMPDWGGLMAGAVAALLLVNAAAFEVRAHASRAWAVFQRTPAMVYAPLNEWIRDNTPADAVIASGLDPFVHWQTGRTAVPNFRFLASDYGAFDSATETLSQDFEQIMASTGARWVAVIEGQGKAGATMAAFAEARPERARVAFEAEVGGFRGVVWEVE